MIGAMLAEVKEYVGIDPSPYSNRGNNVIKDSFSKFQDTKITLIEKPYEEVTEDLGVFDMALTCPPYYDIEKYAGENTSTNKFKTYDAWINGFYEPLIANTMRRLKPDGVFVLFVGDQRYDLADQAIKIASKLGYRSEFEDGYWTSNKDNLRANKKAKGSEKVVLIYNDKERETKEETVKLEKV